MEPQGREPRRLKAPTVSFDALAPLYRPMEAVLAGGLLQRCRTAQLSFLAQGGALAGARALVLGEGPGRFLVELLHRFPDLEVVCVEQSPAMIRQARRRIEHSGGDPDRVEFLPVDALDWNPGGRKFDLIATHFFLDCFPPDELERLVAKISSAAAGEARWVISDFCIPERGWRRLRARAIHGLMYRFFRIATGLRAHRWTPPDCFLRSAGFELQRRRSFNFGLLHSDLWIRTSTPSDALDRQI